MLAAPCVLSSRRVRAKTSTALVLLLLLTTGCMAAPVVVAASAANGRPSTKPPRPPPSHIVAAVKAAREAQDLLSSTTSSAEADAAYAILNTPTTTSERSASALPRGAKAWCPMLNLDTSSATKTSEPSPALLASAINANFTMKNMTWQAAMADELAAIAVAGVWWSAKQRPVPVTLITQASVDRLPQLYSQCKSWSGPLSAVVFLGLLQETLTGLTADSQSLLRKGAVHVSKLFAELEKDEQACQLSIMLVYEVYTERQAMMLYPINVLRNYARLQARTPLLALVDVDMLMGSRFYTDLLTNSAFSKRLVDGGRNKTAFVLPAFETYGLVYEAAALADVLASKGKEFLIDSIKKDIVGPFDHKRFPQGHNWTLFARWYGETEPYQVTYGARYEPWTIVDRLQAPWHDSRFRGYGQNKIVHIANMNSTGFKFVILPNAFIVHRSHQPTTIRQRLVASKTVYDVAMLTKQSVDRTSIYGHTKSLFDDARRQMDAGSFRPVLDSATVGSITALPWWKGVAL